MEGFTIRHQRGGEDTLVTDDGRLYPHFVDGWLVISDAPAHESGTIHYAAPRDHVIDLIRTTGDRDQEE